MSSQEILFFVSLATILILLGLIVYGCIKYNQKQREVIQLKIKVKKLVRRLRELDPSMKDVSSQYSLSQGAGNLKKSIRSEYSKQGPST